MTQHFISRKGSLNCFHWSRLQHLVDQRVGDGKRFSQREKNIIRLFFCLVSSKKKKFSRGVNRLWCNEAAMKVVFHCLHQSGEDRYSEYTQQLGDRSWQTFAPPSLQKTRDWDFEHKVSRHAAQGTCSVTESQSWNGSWNVANTCTRHVVTDHTGRCSQVRSRVTSGWSLARGKVALLVDIYQYTSFHWLRDKLGEEREKERKDTRIKRKKRKNNTRNDKKKTNKWCKRKKRSTTT